MPGSRSSLEQALDAALKPVVEAATASIAVAIADLVAERIERQLTVAVSRRGAAVKVSATRRPARVEITRWVADRRARRVPLFVIDATGLKTKKEIVAKFGPAAFEKGKGLPPVLEVRADEPRVAASKAKGPVVRKKAKAA